MTETKSTRAHLIAGGFPPGSQAGHDHDYARLKLLGLLGEQGIAASVANDFADVEKWLPTSRLLITYVAGPYPAAAPSRPLPRPPAARPPRHARGRAVPRRRTVPRHPALAGGGRPLARPARHQRRPRRAGRGGAGRPARGKPATRASP